MFRYPYSRRRSHGSPAWDHWLDLGVAGAPLASCVVRRPVRRDSSCRPLPRGSALRLRPVLRRQPHPFHHRHGRLESRREQGRRIPYSAQELAVYRSNGDGTFSTGVVYPTGPVDQDRSAQILSADVNGDGNPDLLTGNTGSVSILLGNGDGTFATHADYPSGGSGVAVADVNGDGKPDVATTTSVLLGNGDGTFQAKIDYSTIPNSYGSYPQQVLAADLNGDGYADLLTMDSGNTYFVSLSHGDGTFDPPVDHFPGYPAAAFRRSGATSRSAKAPRTVEYFGNEVWPVLRDVNGDGRQDLIFVNGGGGQFVSTATVLLGLGDGTFGPRVDYRVQDYPSYIAVGDLNVDGNPDLVTANDYSAT